MMLAVVWLCNFEISNNILCAQWCFQNYITTPPIRHLEQSDTWPSRHQHQLLSGRFVSFCLGVLLKRNQEQNIWVYKLKSTNYHLTLSKWCVMYWVHWYKKAFLRYDLHVLSPVNWVKGNNRWSIVLCITTPTRANFRLQVPDCTDVSGIIRQSFQICAVQAAAFKTASKTTVP